MENNKLYISIALVVILLLGMNGYQYYSNHQNVKQIEDSYNRTMYDAVMVGFMYGATFHTSLNVTYNQSERDNLEQYIANTSYKECYDSKDFWDCLSYATLEYESNKADRIGRDINN